MSSSSRAPSRFDSASLHAWLRRLLGIAATCAVYFFSAPLALAVPVVVNSTPADYTVGVWLGASVTLQFGSALDSTTITTDNVLVTSSLRGTLPVSLVWNALTFTLTIDPMTNCVPGERIEVALTKGVRDGQGQALPNGWRTEFSSWTATTPSAAFGTTGTTWPIGSIAFNATVGDLTGDGFPEMIFSNVVPDSLTIFTPDGNGSFSLLARIHRPNATLPRHVALGDLDEDGRLDLVVCASGMNQVQVIRNLGNGAFAPPILFATGQTPYGAYVGDVDADGDLDVATANFNSDDISVLLNTGGGVLGLPTHTSAGVGADSPRWLDGADLDHDGDVDLAACNGYSHNVSVFLNDGSGVFAVPTAILAVGTSPQFLATRDFTGDGVADIVTVNSVAESVSLLVGIGDGTFASAVHTTVAGQFPYGIQVVDLDGDDDLDLVLPIRGASAWQPVWNNGAGGFTAGSLNFGGIHCHTVGAADWDGDGDIDVAAGFAISQTMQLYKQAPQPVVAQVSPARNSAGLLVDGWIDLIFNVDLTPASVVPGSFAVQGNQSGWHAVTVDWSAPLHRLRLMPVTPFVPGETVTVTAKGGGVIESTDGLDYGGDVLEFMTTGEPAPGTFSSPPRVALPGLAPIDVVAADLDGDGRSDLVVANLLSDNVTTLLSGGGTPAVAQTLVTGGSPAALVSGDLDSDADVDVAVACLGPRRIDLLRNDGATLVLGGTIALDGVPFSLGGRDLDRDGDLDLVVACLAPDALRVLRNDGGGVFAGQPAMPLPGSPTDVSLADLDTDGDIDLATTIDSNASVQVHFGDGSGGFANGGSFPTPAGPAALFAGDMNDDGAVDLAVSCSAAGSLSLLTNLGAGTFSAGPPLVSSSLPRAVWGGDLTGDGRFDLATAGSADDILAVLCSEGGGAWCNPWTLSVGDSPFSLAAGDFNGDGRVDLTAVNRSSGDLSLLLAEVATEVVAPVALEGARLRVWPNPFRESLAVELHLPGTGTPASVAIYDVSGRVVARLLDGVSPKGTTTLSWDGRDPDGRRTAGGVYFLRLESSGRSWTRKLIRIG